MPIKEIPLEQGYKLLNPGSVVLITSASGEKKNVMTLAWTSIINSEPFIIGIAMGNQAYSAKLIRKSREFAINIPGKNLLGAVRACGETSGINVDKFKKAKLTVFRAKKVRAPLVQECFGWLECRVIKAIKFGDVNFFISKVLAVSASDKYYDDGWIPEKAQLIHHLGGGSFYFSSKKTGLSG